MHVAVKKNTFIFLDLHIYLFWNAVVSLLGFKYKTAAVTSHTHTGSVRAFKTERRWKRVWDTSGLVTNYQRNPTVWIKYVNLLGMPLCSTSWGHKCPSGQGGGQRQPWQSNHISHNASKAQKCFYKKKVELLGPCLQVDQKVLSHSQLLNTIQDKCLTKIIHEPKLYQF